MNIKKRFTTQRDYLRMLHTDPELLDKMSEKIMTWLPPFPREYVVVFIGTDRSTGDALGPLAGTLFNKMKPKHITVYGTLHNPVHAKNLTYYINKIDRHHHHPFIIAIDACLGKAVSIGKLIAGTGSIRPGAALNKSLPSIGDIHITGVVNMSGFMEYSILQSTRLSTVMDMSNSIAQLLDVIDQQLTYNHSLPALAIPQKPI